MCIETSIFHEYLKIFHFGQHISCYHQILMALSLILSSVISVLFLYEIDLAVDWDIHSTVESPESVLIGTTPDPEKRKFGLT